MRLTTVSITTIAVMTAIITMVLLTACNQAAPPLVGGDKDAHGCIGSAGYSWCEAKAKCLRPFEEKCEAAPAIGDGQLVGGDKDAHGCLPSAGYTWCEAKQQCIRPWEENCTTAPSPVDGTTGTDSSCTCPSGYRQEGTACNPECYYSMPKCLMPSIMCQSAQPGTAGADATVPDASAPEPQLVGNDRDEHGCIGSAGYSWCESKRMCLRPWEEPCLDDGSPQ